MDAISVRTRRWVNGAAYVLMIAVNALADIIPLLGVKTAEVSRAYDHLFTPAPFTFAVWGVIYALLAGFVLFQAGVFDHAGERSTLVVERGGWWFVGSCVLNSLWIVCWHARLLGVCVLLMAGLLTAVLVLSTRMAMFNENWKERWMVRASFSLYGGWVTVATIAGVAAWLTQIGWRGFGLSAQAWTVAVAALGLVIALLTAWRRQDGFYALAAAWGFAGLTIRHAARSGFAGAYPVALLAVSAACAVLVIEAAVLFLRKQA